MQCHIITKKDNQASTRLALLLSKEFPEITAAGNLDILADSEQLTGLFCSRKCPGSLILPAFDHVAILRDSGKTVIGGFHAEMEQECLKMLLRGSQPVIICPARSIHNMRVPDNWKTALAANRLLILSPFEKNHKRMTAKLAEQRNRFVAALSDELFIIHAGSRTGTFNLAVETMRAGKRIFTIKDAENQVLIEAGAVAV